MKICFKCKRLLDMGSFYKHKKMKDGHLNKCKECARRDVLLHREENIEKIRRYDRERASSPKRRLASFLYLKKYREENPNRDRVYSKLARAVKCGVVQKLPCFVCGNELSEAHHPSYDLPLDVVWLCAVHHKEIHLRKN